jgi:hypothetical protein
LADKFFRDEVEAVGVDAVDDFDPDAVDGAVGVFGDLEEFRDAAFAGTGRGRAVGGRESGAGGGEGAFVGGGAGEIGSEGSEGTVGLGGEKFVDVGFELEVLRFADGEGLGEGFAVGGVGGAGGNESDGEQSGQEDEKRTQSFHGLTS